MLVSVRINDKEVKHRLSGNIVFFECLGVRYSIDFDNAGDNGGINKRFIQVILLFEDSGNYVDYTLTINWLKEGVETRCYFSSVDINNNIQIEFNTKFSDNLYTLESNMAIYYVGSPIGRSRTYRSKFVLFTLETSIDGISKYFEFRGVGYTVSERKLSMEMGKGYLLIDDSEFISIYTSGDEILDVYHSVHLGYHYYRFDFASEIWYMGFRVVIKDNKVVWSNRPLNILIVSKRLL